jgi:YD repeat-containing protein
MLFIFRIQILGRKQTMIDPDMGSWQYQYDAVGNLTAQRDARLQWLHLEHVYPKSSSERTWPGW